MGHVKDIANQSRQQTFPGATYEFEGTTPVSQCTAPSVFGSFAQTFTAFPGYLLNHGSFAGEDYTGKFVTITQSPHGNPGTYGITSNTDDLIQLDGDPGNSNNVSWYLHNGDSLRIIRNIADWAALISAGGYSYTIKGGKLYTNVPQAAMEFVCPILFDPLT